MLLLLVTVQLVPAVLPALVGADPARRGWAVLMGSLGRRGLGNLAWEDFLLAERSLPVLDDVDGLLLLLLLAVLVGLLEDGVPVRPPLALSAAAFWAVNSRTISAVRALVLGKVWTS